LRIYKSYLPLPQQQLNQFPYIHLLIIMALPPSQPAAPNGTSNNFDIISTYTNLLATDPSITMPIAAIRALLRSLESHPTTTAAETLQYLSSQVAILTASQPNHLSLSAGTDLFQRYIVWSMERQGGTSDFSVVRERLLASGAELAQIAAKSRAMVARVGKDLVREDSTVLTLGGSRVVGALLAAAAAHATGPVRFRVLYVLPEPGSSSEKPEGGDIAGMLREKGIPTATVPINSVSHLMGERRVDLVIVGAEAVVENGGAVSRMGTSLIAWAAKERGIPFYVAAESQKFVRKYPNDTYEVPLRQNVVKYTCVEDGQMEEIENNVRIPGQDQPLVTNTGEFVDYTVCS
jgi:translation initiation factor eIF-2B subunit alpha